MIKFLCLSAGAADTFDDKLLIRKAGFTLLGADVDQQDTIVKSLCDQWIILDHRSDEQGFTDELIEICKNYHVDLIAPSHEADIIALVMSAQKIREATGAKILGTTDPKVLNLIYKDRLHQHLISLHLPSFETYFDIEDVPLNAYPILCKRCLSRGGDGSFIARTKKAAELFLELTQENEIYHIFGNRKFVFQPLYYDYKGDFLTIEIYFSSQGGIVQVIPFRALRKRDFIHSMFETFIDKSLVEYIRKLIESLRISFFGALNIDGFWDGQSFMPMDMNVRPTKAISLSYLAGFNYYLYLYNAFQSIDMPVASIMSGITVGRVERNLVKNGTKQSWIPLNTIR